MVMGRDYNDAPVAAYPGIDNDDMDSPGGEVVKGILDKKGGLDDVVRRYGVAEVNNSSLGSSGENNAFHGGDIAVTQTKISGQGNKGG